MSRADLKTIAFKFHTIHTFSLLAIIPHSSQKPLVRWLT